MQDTTDTAPVPAAKTAGKLTADIYWRSLDPIIQKLRTMKDAGERWAYAQEIASRGYTVDMAIQVDQEMLPQDVMRVRTNFGFTWVPAANQPNIPTMPGDDVPGLPAYDPNAPPDGSIKVSMDPDDYPPFGGAPPEVAIPKPSVGEKFALGDGRTIFLPGIGLDENLISEGQVVESNGVEYVAHVDWRKRPPIYFTKA